MATINRLDEIKIIATLLNDIHKKSHGVLTTRALKLTIRKMEARARLEGLGFLTKSLPRLGKALDRALSSDTPLELTKLGFKTLPGMNLPWFMGEFFKRIFDPTGTVLPDPCADSVRVLRQVLYLFYKYELPYSDEQEHAVVSKFIETEETLKALHGPLSELDCKVWAAVSTGVRLGKGSVTPDRVSLVRKARILLERVFSGLDLRDIVPRHGPGAVATKQQLWAKYQWTNVSSRIRSVYPLDAYFYASLGHVCDDITGLNRITDYALPARVILVPKDSRGPRLISCEPVDNQWIQQGLMTKIVQHVERIGLTKHNVFFTNQQPNQFGALLGSRTGKYSTLDLNEASDRVSLDLVRLLFPPHVSDVLEAVRSSSTVLPNGKTLSMAKHAPMGSALCFPILALTVWSILTAGAPDADTRESILVYGDDVIVPQAYALNAIEHLESFGLKINRDKSCIRGPFRESCGMDAFKGVSVTPVRFRTVWSSTPAANTYVSWIAYANSMYDRQYFETYEIIVEMLHSVYGAIPDDSMRLACPSLREVSDAMRPCRKRTHQGLQKLQYYVRDIKSASCSYELPGWSMLLRFFTEAGRAETDSDAFRRSGSFHSEPILGPGFSVRKYTKRGHVSLVRRWR